MSPAPAAAMTAPRSQLCGVLAAATSFMDRRCHASTGSGLLALADMPTAALELRQNFFLVARALRDSCPCFTAWLHESIILHCSGPCHTTRACSCLTTRIHAPQVMPLTSTARAQAGCGVCRHASANARGPLCFDMYLHTSAPGWWATPHLLLSQAVESVAGRGSAQWRQRTPMLAGNMWACNYLSIYPPIHLSCMHTSDGHAAVELSTYTVLHSQLLAQRHPGCIASPFEAQKCATPTSTRSHERASTAVPFTWPRRGRLAPLPPTRTALHCEQHKAITTAGKRCRWARGWRVCSL